MINWLKSLFHKHEFVIEYIEQIISDEETGFLDAILVPHLVTCTKCKLIIDL